MKLIIFSAHHAPTGPLHVMNPAFNPLNQLLCAGKQEITHKQANTLQKLLQCACIHRPCQTPVPASSHQQTAVLTQQSQDHDVAGLCCNVYVHWLAHR